MLLNLWTSNGAVSSTSKNKREAEVLTENTPKMAAEQTKDFSKFGLEQWSKQIIIIIQSRALAMELQLASFQVSDCTVRKHLACQPGHIFIPFPSFSCCYVGYFQKTSEKWSCIKCWAMKWGNQKSDTACKEKKWNQFKIHHSAQKRFGLGSGRPLRSLPSQAILWSYELWLPFIKENIRLHFY